MFVITLEDVIAVALILIVCVALVVGVAVRVIKNKAKGGRKALISLLACVLLALCGCADNPDSWEFIVSVPGNTSIERIMEMREHLRANGYKRFKIHTVDFGRAIIIHATEKGAERRDNQVRTVEGCGNSHWRIEFHDEDPFGHIDFDKDTKLIGGVR